MKKILLIALLFLSNSLLYSQFLGGGSGTEIDPYRIYTKEHLEELADSVNADKTPTTIPLQPIDNWSRGRYFMLMNDITDGVKKSIGTRISTSEAARFQGVFDGNNRAINLAIDTVNVRIGGLFVLGNSAVIKNLITTGYVNNTGTSAAALGAMFYLGVDEEAIISNCINLASITNSHNAMGIIGTFAINHHWGSCLVENCINYGLIQGRGRSAGIAFGEGFTVINCANYGVVRSTDTTNITACILPILILPSFPNTNTIINCHYDKQMCGGDD